MLGRSFLVAPVVTGGAARRSVYLPAGRLWYDFWTGCVANGGKSLVRETPQDIMPLYIPAGTILPFGPEVQYSNEKPWDSLEIRVYPGENGHYRLYEDEGDNYDYEKGQFSEITFSWDDKAHKLTIGPRRGSFKGMLKDRTFNIVLVDKNSGTGREPMKVTTSVRYNGKKLTVAL